MSFKRVLIAVDGGTFAAHAAERGLELANELGAEVALLTVVDPCSLPMGVTDDEESWLAMARQEGKDLLNAFASTRISPTLKFVETGSPIEKIVEAARNWPADLIVVGTRGRSALSSLVLGSVAQGVLRHAPCPVLVVRPGV